LSRWRPPVYEFEVRYAYEFQGQTHQSGRLSFFRQHQSANDTHTLVLAYPEGSQAVCFVNPARPEEAVMDRTVDPWSCVLPAGAFTLGGVFLLRWWLVRRVEATTG